MKRSILLIIFLLASVCILMAQNNYSQCYLNNIRMGNDAYSKKNYKEAKAYFLKAKQCPNGNPDMAQKKINNCNKALGISPEDILSSLPDTLSFSADGGEEIITIVAEEPWEIVAKTLSWEHFTKNGSQLIVKLDKNIRRSSRSDWLTIKLGDAEKRLEIFQEAAPVMLSVSVDELDFGSYGGEKTIIVTSNDEWHIGESIATWGRLTRNGDQLIVKIEQNTSTSARSDHFTIRAGDKVQQVNIRQKAAIAIYLTVDGSTSDKSKYFSYSGGRQYYSVSTNASSYEVLGVPYWCSIENKTSSGFTLVCDYNSNYSSRRDFFKVMAAGKEIRIDVEQGARPSPTPTASRSKSSYHKKTYSRPIIIRDYDRFPEGVEWQSMLGFNGGAVGRYHSPKEVLEGTKSLFAGKGSQASDTISFAWDLSYIGGGLVSRCFFIGFGTGVSGYAKASIHKRDIVIPLYVHIAWYMTGNSYVAPYLATSQGMDLYICQDYGQINTSVGLHSRYDLGILIRPDKDYSKLGVSLAFEFGFAPYSYTEERNTLYTYIYRANWHYEETHTVKIQSLHKYSYGLATYIGGYVSIVF